MAVQLIEDYNITKDDVDYIFDRTTTYHSAGRCLMKLQLYQDALLYFYQALDVSAEANLDEEYIVKETLLAEASPLLQRRIRERANVCGDLGLWFIQHNCFKEAAKYLSRAFNVYNKFSEVEKIAAIRLQLLICYMEVYNTDFLMLH